MHFLEKNRCKNKNIYLLMRKNKNARIETKLSNKNIFLQNTRKKDNKKSQIR